MKELLRTLKVSLVAGALFVAGAPVWPADVPPVAISSQPDLTQVARQISVGAGLRLEDLYLEGLGEVDLHLSRFRVFSPDARIEAAGAVQVVPDNAYLRGQIEGFPGSLAVLSFRERGGIGGVALIEGEFWTIEGRAGRAGLTGRRVDPAAEAPSESFDCLSDSLPGSFDALANLAAGESASEPVAGAPAFSYTARVAVETDWEFLNIFGGNQTAATDYVGDLFAFASSIYEREIDTSLHVSFLRLWPGVATDDPWSATSCANQLDEFLGYWRTNETGQQRAIAHMLSGKRSGCGIAYVGVLCRADVGYGVSASLNGNFDPVNPVPAVWDIIVVSHEIGHNFNSPHTHCYNGIPDASYSDPVDSCYSSNGCYAGPTDLPVGCPGPSQACGTIMSYCHLRSGGYGNIALTFGGSVLDGSSHTYGVFPERVPQRMHEHVLRKSACLDPVTIYWTLSVANSGTGTGRVTSNDGAIDCGTDCVESYASGTNPVVTLTATPDGDSTFAGWTGNPDCTDGIVTMSSDVACTATFDLVPTPTHALTVIRSGDGQGTVTSSPPGIDCGVDCNEIYGEGTIVTLTPIPAANSTFAGWSGDGDCADGTVTMTAALACTASFAMKGQDVFADDFENGHLGAWSETLGN